VTIQQAHGVVQRECTKRGRRYGQDNEKILRQMRAEIALLKDKPTRYAYVITKALRGRRSIGDGCYMNGVRSTSWDEE
jgi:hypothetical protein